MRPEIVAYWNQVVADIRRRNFDNWLASQSQLKANVARAYGEKFFHPVGPRDVLNLMRARHGLAVRR